MPSPSTLPRITLRLILAVAPALSLASSPALGAPLSCLRLLRPVAGVVQKDLPGALEQALSEEGGAARGTAAGGSATGGLPWGRWPLREMGRHFHSLADGPLCGCSQADVEPILSARVAGLLLLSFSDDGLGGSLREGRVASLETALQLSQAVARCAEGLVGLELALRIRRQALRVAYQLASSGRLSPPELDSLVASMQRASLGRDDLLRSIVGERKKRVEVDLQKLKMRDGRIFDHDRTLSLYEERMNRLHHAAREEIPGWARRFEEERLALLSDDDRRFVARIEGPLARGDMQGAIAAMLRSREAPPHNVVGRILLAFMLPRGPILEALQAEVERTVLVEKVLRCAWQLRAARLEGAHRSKVRRLAEELRREGLELMGDSCWGSTAAGDVVRLEMPGL